jgi:hypothetical protein
VPLVQDYRFLDQDVKVVQGTAFAVRGPIRVKPGRPTDPVVPVAELEVRGWVRDLGSGQVYSLTAVRHEDDDTVGFYYADTGSWAERDHAWHGEVETVNGWRPCAGGSVQVTRMGR